MGFTRIAFVALAAAVTALVPVTQASGAVPATPASLVAAGIVTSSTTGSGVLVARPAKIDFRSKVVGTENYQRTTIRNTGQSDVRLVVTGGLPDDFGFGLYPGQTCPVFTPGEILPAGASCVAVVRFSPTAGFIGFHAVSSLIATATDPVTGAQVTELSIPVLGTAVARCTHRYPAP